MPQVGTALGCLTAQSVQSGRRSQVARAVVEELTRKSPGRRAVRGLVPGNAGRRLDDAVESSATCPWAVVAPRREAYDDETRMTLGELVGAQSQLLQSPRTVTEDHDIGFVEQLVQNGAPVRIREIESGTALREQRVRDGAWLHVGIGGRVDPQHVGPEGAQVSACRRDRR